MATIFYSNHLMCLASLVESDMATMTIILSEDLLSLQVPVQLPVLVHGEVVEVPWDYAEMTLLFIHTLKW